jgi:hypothetical protein
MIVALLYGKDFSSIFEEVEHISAAEFKRSFSFLSSHPPKVDWRHLQQSAWNQQTLLHHPYR